MWMMNTKKLIRRGGGGIYLPPTGFFSLLKQSSKAFFGPSNLKNFEKGIEAKRVKSKDF